MNVNHIFQGVFILFSLLYLALLVKVPFKGDWLIKAVPALTLAVWAMVSLEGNARWLLAAAMVFSAGGDIALAMVPKGKENFFVVGLGSFLIAHIMYIVLFSMEREFQSDRLWAMILVGVFAVGMAALLYPKLGAMKAPVLVYIAAIAAMGIAATLNVRGGILLLIGTMVFMLSDATIAVNKFLLKEPLPALQYVIMVTYFAAQFMIAQSYIVVKE